MGQRRSSLALADLGYEGEPETFKIPFKKPKNADLTIDQQTYNAVHGALRCLGERANSLLKTTFKALRRYRGCPWRTSSPPPWSCSTTNTDGQHDQQQLITHRRNKGLRGKAH